MVLMMKFIFMSKEKNVYSLETYGVITNITKVLRCLLLFMKIEGIHGPTHLGRIDQLLLYEKDCKNGLIPFYSLDGHHSTF